MKRLLLFATALFVTTTLQADPAGRWTSATKYTRNSLTYSATASLLRQKTPITIVFGCDPTSDKESSGTLGFEVEIKNPSKITAFPFDDFEGPDAVAAPEVRVTLSRKDKPALTFKTSAGGWYSEVDTFCFGVSEVSKKSKSVPRSILQALAEGDAESLKITIANPRDPKRALEMTVPVAGKQSDFQTLLAGLK